MRINKQISVASLEIDPDDGKIWLNSHNCILRIKNLNFTNIEHKFAMIDINGHNAEMIPGDFGEDVYNDFLEKLNFEVGSRIYLLDKNECKKYLDELFLRIKISMKDYDHLLNYIEKNESLCEDKHDFS